MNAKKRALGRGLDALLDSTDYTNKGTKGLSTPQNAGFSGIAEISLSYIYANPNQPRKAFDEESLKQLADSIKQQGIIQPITVRKIARNRYELISGERRFRACQLIKLEGIPAYVREADNTQALEMALVENIQRQDLNALEIALSYQHLIKDCDLKMEDLGDRVGKSRSTVNNYLRLLKLPDAIQIGLREDKLSMGHARAIISIESEQDQLIIFDEILKKELSVRQVEKYVRKIQDKSQKKVVSSQLSLPYKYKQLHGKLKKEFSNEIDIKRNLKGKGNISFSFKDDTELDKLLQKLLK